LFVFVCFVADVVGLYGVPEVICLHVVEGVHDGNGGLAEAEVDIVDSVYTPTYCESIDVFESESFVEVYGRGV